MEGLLSYAENLRKCRAEFLVLFMSIKNWCILAYFSCLPCLYPVVVIICAVNCLKTYTRQDII